MCSLESAFLIGRLSGIVGPLFLGKIGVTDGLFIYYKHFLFVTLLPIFARDFPKGRPMQPSHRGVDAPIDEDVPIDGETSPSDGFRMVKVIR